jgi:hypothetical protein
MLATIVRAVVASQADFELDGEVVGASALAAAIRDTSPDVVILRGPLSRENAKRLLYPVPQLKIVTIDHAGRTGEVHELRHVSSPLPSISPSRLVTAIRGSIDRVDQRGTT